MFERFKKWYYNLYPDLCEHKRTVRTVEVVSRNIGKVVVYDVYGMERCAYCNAIVAKKRLAKNISTKKPEELINAKQVATEAWL